MLTDDGTCWVNLGIVIIITGQEKDKDYPKQTVSNTKQDLPDKCPRRGNQIIWT